MKAHLVDLIPIRVIIFLKMSFCVKSVCHASRLFQNVVFLYILVTNFEGDFFNKWICESSAVILCHFIFRVDIHHSFNCKMIVIQSVITSLLAYQNYQWLEHLHSFWIYLNNCKTFIIRASLNYMVCLIFFVERKCSKILNSLDLFEQL